MEPEASSVRHEVESENVSGSGALGQDGVESSCEPLIEFTGLTKTFGPTRAISGLDLTIRTGEILGLVGANGAGKSTLLRTVSGTVAPTAGRMSIDGHEVDFARYRPHSAQGVGIHCVYQELSLCANLTVAENFELTRTHSHGRSRSAVIDAADASVNSVFPAAGFGPRTEVSQLQHAQRQMVEIARAGTQPGLRLLILDEPTSALPSERVAQLHVFLEACKKRNVGVIYVTHKLDEILRIADRLVVMRSGRKVWDVDGAVSREALVEHLGGVAAEAENVAPTSRGQAALADAPSHAHLVEITTRELVNGPHWSGEPLVVRPGEVVGLAGLEGSGQKQLLRQLFFAGRRRATNGIAVHAQAAYVSGDRKREAVFPMWSIADNIALTGLRAFANRLGVIRTRELRQGVDRWFKDLAIVAPSPDSQITDLSGGNQQKAVIARGLVSGAQLLLMDDPTRGVDLETKEAVYALLREVRAEGRSAIYYSTEDAEFLYCDRVYVLAAGRVVHELVGPDEITLENIVSWSYRGLEKVAA